MIADQCLSSGVFSYAFFFKGKQFSRLLFHSLDDKAIPKMRYAFRKEFTHIGVKVDPH